MLSLSARAVQIFAFIIPPAVTMIVSARESAIPVWQCLFNGTLINPHDVIPSHNNVTDTGRANSVIWPSYPGGKLTTAGCDSNFTLVNLLHLLWRKDGSVLTHVSNDKHSHLIPAAFESSSQEILIRLQDVNVVVLNQTRIRQPSDSS